MKDEDEKEDATDLSEPEKIKRSEKCWEDWNNMKYSTIFRRKCTWYLYNFLWETVR